MKIGILTRRAGYNMGSSLQAYAMARLFSNLGHDVEVLDYDEYSRFLIWRVKPAIYRMLYCILHIFPFLSISSLAFQKFKRMFKQQHKFKLFERTFLPLSHKRYRNFGQIAKTLGSYDIYVCGSDQIWSPYMFDPVFLLDFVPQGIGKIRKIAYAPSIGVTNLDAISKEQCRMMSSFDYISCREQEGANLLSKLLHRKVPMVLDPTLMIERSDWEKIQSDINLPYGGHYILTYFLHTRYYKNNIPNNFIYRLKKSTGCPVVNIQMYNMEQVIDADMQMYAMGPSDFIRLLAGASYIVTNSYHCCIFSYIFKKCFFAFERYRLVGNVNEDQNQRIHSLLNILGMSDALIKDEKEEIDLYTLQNSKVSNRLEIEQKRSLDFLDSALN